MKAAIRYLTVILLMMSCVPSAKFKKAQTDINSLKKENISLKSYSDSVNGNYISLKSDYNTLSYDFDETQRYTAFSDKELLKELNKEKAEGKKNLMFIHQLQAQALFSSTRSELRAQTFSKDASCLLGTYSQNKFILLKHNILTIDIEGLMSASSDKQAELRGTLKDLFYSLHNREDVIISVSLYQSGINSNWSKVTLQQELLGFLVSEASVQPSKILGSTKIISKEKSLEFGVSTDSRLLLELEFKG
ncbi:MAG: hypothetical protein H7329_17310 [Opitutaceae bacterium]|nr:hypothetical protein [Cytophagales bacterium]